MAGTMEVPDDIKIHDRPAQHQGVRVMAGYVKLSRSIWTDRDFTALPAAQQRLYLLLISQPDISHVGIVPYMPARWAHFATDTTTVELTLALSVLCERGFVAVDKETGEVWVRSYIKYDEAFKIPNGRKALVSAYERVYSEHLRTLIGTVLGTLDVTVTGRVGGTEGSSHHHQPVTSTQEPPPPAEGLAESDSADTASDGGGGGALTPKQIALNVAAMLLDHEPNVDRPGPWKARVAERLMREHAIAALQRHMDDDDVAQAIFDAEMPTAVVKPERTPEFDPDCPDCAGTGVVFIEGTLDSRRCECHAVMLGRQDADVIPMRRVVE